MAESESAALLQPATLRNLLEQLSVTGVDEIEIVRGESRLYVRREPGDRWTGDPSVDRGSDARQVIAAPLTGIYYERPKPDQPPFVTVGTTIHAGQVVALIETMKLFNEVTADITGEVAEVVPLDGDLVEVGHPLMYVNQSEE